VSKGDTTAEINYRFAFPWLILFVILKLGGPAALWSWWWLLLPVVPDLVVLLHKFGVL
jgi:hypothetical protein